MELPTLEVQYGNYPVREGQRIPISRTRNEPNLYWNAEAGSKYVIIMYDFDARDPPYLHWIVINATTDDPGLELAPYTPPHPPGSEIHEYTIEIFLQPDPIANEWIAELPDRDGFPLNEFINNNGLVSLGALTFKTGFMPDGYA